MMETLACVVILLFLVSDAAVHVKVFYGAYLTQPP
jgi:hypothetical protein